MLPRSRSSNAWLARVSAPWLAFWRSEFRVDFFHPFDLLASARVLAPDLLECDPSHAWVVRAKSDNVNMNVASHREGDSKEAHGYGVASKLYLHVGDLKWAPVAATAKRTHDLLYCHTPKPALRAALVSALAAGDRGEL